MAARKQRTVRPIDAALARLLALAGKGVPPGRVAREVESIVAEWLAAAGTDERVDVRERLDELLEQLAAGVADAEEQMASTDGGEPAAVKQADLTLATLVATRDAAARARAAL